jgi:hypothetical protein
MANDLFAFVNDSREKISFSHERTNARGATYHLDPQLGERRKVINVTIPSNTFEKYWLLDATGKVAGDNLYVTSDNYKCSKQVTVTKQGDDFILTYVPR